VPLSEILESLGWAPNSARSHTASFIQASHDPVVSANVVFTPNESKQKSWEEHLDNIPRYLFRTYDANSSGTTNTDVVMSRAYMHSRSVGRLDLFSMPANEAADILNQHLQWDRRHDKRDNLMSWTSSLLVAILYGLFRSQSIECGRSDLSNIFLCVVDTRRFPRGSFLQDLPLIEEFHNKVHPPSQSYTLRDLKRLRERTEFYFGEYLSQGRLDILGRSSHATLGKMIELGLPDVCPGLSDLNFKWAKRVTEYRRNYLESSKTYATSALQIRKAMTIAQACFDDEFSLPITAMLLGMQARAVHDEIIARALSSCFSGKQVDAS
jgi:hypothetical protein